MVQYEAHAAAAGCGPRQLSHAPGRRLGCLAGVPQVPHQQAARSGGRQEAAAARMDAPQRLAERRANVHGRTCPKQDDLPSATAYLHTIGLSKFHILRPMQCLQPLPSHAAPHLSVPSHWSK